MTAARTALLRCGGVLAIGLAWFLACGEQPIVSAEEISAALAKDQLDDRSLADLTAAMASDAKRFSEAVPKSRSKLGGAERKDWDFWPSRYPGARMDQIAPEHQALADRLLRLGLSAQGYEKVKVVQALEPFNPWRSPYYSLIVFGDPTADKAWGWRFQGHHLSLNFTLVDGKAIATTPLFLGTQPLSRPDIAGGKGPLAAEEALARKLYRSLSSGAKRKADIDRPPYTYLPERIPVAERQQPMGVEAKDLSAEQRETLTALIRAYVENVAPSIASERRRETEQAGLDGIGFAWAGSDRPGRDHYYRIQGPTFIIEYDSRDDGSHIHSVWRSFEGDFGEDLLREHYASAEPHARDH